jgi:hypothetical protein
LRAILEAIKLKEKRLIVGIETGNVPGRLGATVIEVSGMGDNTVLHLLGFRSLPLPQELIATLKALENDGEFDSEEMAGINFLVLHQISSLFMDLLDDVEIKAEEIDLIGLKGLEIGGILLPEDPSTLSEATGSIVATHFCIGFENSSDAPLPVKESILRSMVADMIDRFGLESEMREAAAVALLANESLFHESCEPCDARRGAKGSAARSSLKARKRTGLAGDKATPCLYGEFFFPV